AGYTIFEQTGHGLYHEWLMFVPAEDPIKVMRLKVRNLDDRDRRLSATFYAEWVLGTIRDRGPMEGITEKDEGTGAPVARNPSHPDFPGHLAFANVSLRPCTMTADRTEFLGRHGTLQKPAALTRTALSGRVGPGLDPCAAIQVSWELRPGEQKEVVFFL